MKYQVTLFYIYIFSIFFLFFFGFYIDENSAGAGGYSGDLLYIWNNQNTFNNFSLKEAIGFTADYDPKYYQSSKMPLSYILNKYLNPLANNIENFRTSVFILSCVIPLFFFFSLKNKFKKNNNLEIILLSIFLFLSPYFRTSAYWGLEENYGILFLLISAYFYIKTKNSEIECKKEQIFFLTLFSSACVYLDQKLVIVPLICYCNILFSKNSFKIKTFATFFYVIFSLPCFYLFYRWGNVLPVVDATNREIGKIHIENIAYTITIIAFYFFPLIFFKSKIKNLYLTIKSKHNLIILILFTFYLIITFLIIDTELPKLGGGFATKFSSLIFQDIINQKITFIIIALLSLLILLIFLEKNLNDTLIVIFFTLISLFMFPIYQEYFDPLIILLVFLFFKIKLQLNLKNVNILIIYYLSLLSINNIYY